MGKRLFAALFGLCFGVAMTAAAEEWELKGITGHMPGNWDTKTANWKWDDGNPCTDRNAQWQLYYQTENDPALSALGQPMIKGLAWKYNYVWRDNSDQADPMFYYLERTLVSGRRTDFGKGPASTIAFTPAQPGKFAVAIAGAIKVQSPTAGHALATVYLLENGTGKTTLLKEINLNNPGGFGGFAERLDWQSQIDIPANTVLVFRLQSVNPGPAPCGKATLTFTKFKIQTQQ